MKLLPRDEDGHNVLAECIESNISMINMLVDARGGFYVFNPDKRKEYFALSTALHKSLWHFRMVTSK